jgi:hypothetical protein
MDLQPFIKTHVAPGEPLTAQAWNDLVDAIDEIHRYLVGARQVVRVKITTPGLDPAEVRVTAVRSDGGAVEAVRPVGSDEEHILTGLETGAWSVVAGAVGYESASKPVEITGEEEEDVRLEMTLNRKGPEMPDLFGLSYGDAADQLAEAGIPVVRVLDFTGQDIVPSSPDPDQAAAPVLVQWPDAGTTVASGGARLVVAVPVEVERGIEVPSLAGLTQSEAQKALEAIGLQLGKVRIMAKRAQ